MNLLGNITRIIFGGLFAVGEYVVAGVRGVRICSTHLLFGLIPAVTAIGIPLGKRHFKLAGLGLNPFGKDVLYRI